jgi:hypothetical protein
MVDASSAELLREMNEKRKKARLLPGAIVLSVIVLLLLLAAGMPAWLVESRSGKTGQVDK